MIIGHIDDNKLFATVSVGWLAGVQKLTVLVDTGFSGELKIPRSLAHELRLQSTHLEEIYLANGHVYTMPAATAIVSLEGHTETVQVLLSDGLPLIGIGLFWLFGYDLHTDLKTNSFRLEKSKN